MYIKALLATFMLSSLALATPLPGDINVPITDTEWEALRAGGLKARSNVNQPITAPEWAALEGAGLTARNESSSQNVARDSVMNCGHHVTGKGGSNGHGKWVPVKEFVQMADTFCSAYVGTDISKGHETSDTYGVSLTNQDNDSQPGPPGNLVFAIYNTDRDGTYVVDHDTCMRAMKAPLGDHANVKRDGHVLLGKRDNCWGHKHNDYEGGYYKVDGIGAFGSEVYAA